MNALAQTARLAGGAPASAEPAQYLTFMLAGEAFAIGILAIKEIIEYHSLTEVPMMPASVRGVINLRGAVVPVMDLLARFGRPSSEVSKRTCIVIVEVETGGERQVIGVMVDAVNEVLDIAPADIEPPPNFGARIRSDFIQGMGKVKGRFVILLDVDHVLSLDEAGALAALQAEAQDEPAH
ncbi:MULTISPECIES: chemotaxis protein CheW [unclassified Variovorax]|uniref:chemotaxis protein CheW n=1 Tax=unclassified Variovorax TaxID=663243 RepID=UPI001318F04F|nr:MULTISPECIES: chemotaxis protein CheW [unclassified Variovorax]VTU25249.1 Chemotaxis protein CheW [Variovorax sp. SRS16]VTU33219.1 Chemotaxis protein CheW [Variovorax sp. PBL-E5]